MPLAADPSPTESALAHPLSGVYHLDLPAALAALAVALLVFAVALMWPQRVRQPADAVSTSSWAGALTPLQVGTRAAAVVLLVLSIAAGRLGVDDELENLAPALIVGAGWPLLVLASVVAGSVWRWIDPWDAVVRTFTGELRLPHGDASARPPEHVWPAVALALPWVWYLSAYPDPLDPRAVGTALALYTMVTLAGCVAVGRTRWLSFAEPLGITLSWLALAARGRLAGWQPPRGAEALLGVLAGGVLFGAVRRSGVWGQLNVSPLSLLYATLGLAVSCALVAGFLVAMARLASRAGGPGSVARVVVPAVAGIVVAVALARNRLFVSVQLLPGLFGDPFGLGWDVLGPAVDDLHAAPLGATGLLIAQLVVLVLAHLRGAALVGLPRDDSARAPAATALAALAAVSMLAVASH